MSAGWGITYTRRWEMGQRPIGINTVRGGTVCWVDVIYLGRRCKFELDYEWKDITYSEACPISSFVISYSEKFWRYATCTIIIFLQVLPWYQGACVWYEYLDPKLLYPWASCFRVYKKWYNRSVNTLCQIAEFCLLYTANICNLVFSSFFQEKLVILNLCHEHTVGVGGCVQYPIKITFKQMWCTVWYICGNANVVFVMIQPKFQAGTRCVWGKKLTSSDF